MKKKFLTNKEKQAIKDKRVKIIIESFAKTFNKIKRLDENDVSENGKGLWANIHAKRKRGEKPAKPGDDEYPETLNIEATSADYAAHADAQADASAEASYMHYEGVKDKVAKVLKDSFEFNDPDSLEYITDSLMKIVDAELDGLWHEVVVKQPNEIKEWGGSEFGHGG